MTADIRALAEFALSEYSLVKLLICYAASVSCCVLFRCQI